MCVNTVTYFSAQNEPLVMELIALLLVNCWGEPVQAPHSPYNICAVYLLHTRYSACIIFICTPGSHKMKGTVVMMYSP